MKPWIGASFAAAAIVLSGCSSTPDPVSKDASFQGLIQQELDQARDGGAEAEQLAVLERAAGAGNLAFADYELAVNSAWRCMRSSGLTVSDVATTEDRGFKVINYSYYSKSGLSDDDVLRLGDACLAKHSKWVEETYQVQPSSKELEDAKFEQFRPALVDCLKRNGVDVRGDAKQADLAKAALKLSQIDGDPNTPEGPDCMAEVGL